MSVNGARICQVTDQTGHVIRCNNASLKLLLHRKQHDYNSADGGGKVSRPGSKSGFGHFRRWLRSAFDWKMTPISVLDTAVILGLDGTFVEL